MSEPRFDVVVHVPHHLRLCAMLSATTEVEFSTLRDALGLTDPTLSKYLRALVEAGYVELAKPVSRGRRRTWASMTPTGRRAFAGHLAELQRMAAAPTVLS